MSTTALQRLLEPMASGQPQAIALRAPGEPLTYRALQQRAAAVAAGLQARGVRPGERVAWRLPNGPEAVQLSLACYWIGAVSVPLNARLTPAEQETMLATIEPRWLVLPDSGAGENAGATQLGQPVLPWSALEGHAPIEATADLPADHPALILFTSGSTGTPKAVVHSHRGCLAAIDTCRQALGLQATDVVLVGKPLCHAGGLQTQLLPSLLAGAQVVLANRPPPLEAAALIQEHGVSEFGLLASDLLDFVDHLEAHRLALPSLHTVIGSGDTVPVELQERFEALLGFPVLEGCGMTEVGGYYAVQPRHGPRKPGSLGLPTPGTELRLLPGQGTAEVLPGEVGEIAVRTASVTTGYWRQPEATRELFRGGWLLSGDLGRRDADGTLWFCGRRKLLIVRRGSNIAPAEIEELLDAHPAVHAAVVVGVPHPRDGEVPVAWVQPQPGAALPGPAVLEAYLSPSLAAFKQPVHYLAIAELPRNGIGKLDRALLRRRAVEQLASTPAPPPR
jgi:acyl-CoA synthetase (AMP-forming)/AMP-acid ligase II